MAIQIIIYLLNFEARTPRDSTVYFILVDLFDATHFDSVENERFVWQKCNTATETKYRNTKSGLIRYSHSRTLRCWCDNLS